MKRLLAFAVIAVALAPAAYGTGFLIPDDARYGGLQLESHRVTVDINEQAAVTKVVEVFHNQHSAQLEATFVFPLPKDASVSDFKMYVNGKLVTGQIMDAAQARSTYEAIVRRMRDPGLLEYMDSRLLKLRVFPIPKGSTQEVQIAYHEALKAEDGLVEYVYPLRTPRGTATTVRDFTMTVDISARAGIKSVYSPTHNVFVDQRDDHHAIASFEKAQGALDRDFQLFYSLSDKDFGASLLSERGDEHDGYFMLILSPRVEVREGDVAPKDVAFVLDISGSMQGEKIEQAKKALRFCVGSLNDRDRFTIIPFNVAVQPLSEHLLDATDENRRKAEDFIAKLQANGGTNIDEALKTALAARGDSRRPYIVAFLTDGLPTVGTTDAGQILGDVKRANTAGTRIFPFGVGYDVNTNLLDELARTTGAVTEYVQPGEDIEVKVSSFFKRVGDPLLSDIRVDFGGADAYDIYPPQVPDLFRGGQVTLTGRYRHAGHASVTLKGRGADREEVFEYPVEFADHSGRAEFVPNVWAGRKIAYLLGEIRLHGENSELKDEVIRLSKQYGIVTPYTSYLVTDGSPVVRDLPMMLDRDAFIVNYPPAAGRPEGMGAMKRMTVEEKARLSSLDYDEGRKTAAAAPASGARAVTASQAYTSLTTADKEDKGGVMRRVSGRTFANINGVWVDTSVKKDQKTLTVKFGSDAYFAIVKAAATLKDAFALGDKVILVIGDYCVSVGDEGVEKADDADVKAVTAAAAKIK